MFPFVDAARPARCTRSRSSRWPSSPGPFGTVIFMAIDRRYGRGAKLTLALFLLGSSTAGIAFLPGYALAGGYADRACSRCAHRPGHRARRHLGRPAVAARAERAGEPARLVRDDPAARRAARACSSPARCSPTSCRPVDARTSWTGAGAIRSSSPSRSTSWRCSRGCGIVVDARVRAAVRDARAAARAGRARRVRTEGGNIVIGAFAPLASFALFHMVTVFPLSWVSLFTGEASARFLVIEIGRRRRRRGGDHGLGRARRPHRAARSCSSSRRWRSPSSAASRRSCSTAASIGENVYHGRRASSCSASPSASPRARSPRSFTPALPLYRLGADLRPRLAVRRRLRAAGGAGPASPLRPGSLGAYLLSGAVCTLIALVLSRRLE